MTSTFRVLLFFAFLVVTAAANAQISSDFNGSADGWTTPGDADATITYSATGGNTSGYVSGSPYVLVLGATTFYVNFYFVAPGKFTGNRSGYYNGTLRYDIQPSSIGTGIQYAEAILTDNGGVSIYYYPSTQFQPAAPPAWTRFSITLNEVSGFWKTSDSPTGTPATQAQIRSVLTSLARLEIRGLYRDANTTNRLDNVTLMPPITVTTQPLSSTVCSGTTATFTTAANSNPNITYQWEIQVGRASWINVTNTAGYSGATTNRLSVNTTGDFGAGVYRCRISGTNVDDQFTNAAALTVNPTPAAPGVKGNYSCDPAAITLTASGAAQGEYRWYTVPNGGNPLPNQVSATLTTPVLTQTTTYYVAAFNGICESARTPAVAEISPPICTNEPPVIDQTPLSTQIEGIITISLEDLISDTDNNADLSTLSIVTPPASGAIATIDNNYNLVINYKGLSFSGKESIALQVCDIFSACVQQTLNIEVVGEIVVYNAISPNNDDFNPIFLIQHIEKLEDTRRNRVTIFNRWGDIVWDGTNYDNTSTVFRGKSKNDDDLPTGTYFYKIEFDGKRPLQSGYLSLKR